MIKKYENDNLVIVTCVKVMCDVDMFNRHEKVASMSGLVQKLCGTFQ